MAGSDDPVTDSVHLGAETMASENSFDARAELEVGGRTYEIYRLDALQAKLRRRPAALLAEDPAREPAAQRGRRRRPHARTSRRSRPGTTNAEPSKEIAFTPARVMLQDFTGVPCVVDLAAMRDAMADLGGDPAKINPLVPAELVIDHSVQVDAFGSARRVPHQRRARVRAQPGALRVPALGPDARSRASRSCRPTRASSTRSTSSTSRASCSSDDGRARTPTRWSAPTRTRR